MQEQEQDVDANKVGLFFVFSYVEQIKMTVRCVPEPPPPKKKRPGMICVFDEILDLATEASFFFATKKTKTPSLHCPLPPPPPGPVFALREY